MDSATRKVMETVETVPPKRKPKYPLNIRLYPDGMPAAFKQSFKSHLLSLITLSLYTGWTYVLMLLVCFSWNKYVLLILIFLLSTVLLPARPVLWPAFNRSYVFRTWREYFHLSYLYESDICAEDRFVYAHFPHGVFPLGPVLSGTLMQTLRPDLSVYSLAATSVFYVPVWRHLVAWWGAVPASPENYRKLLKTSSVAVIVGGIAEMFMQHPRQEQLILKNRKGFVRIAVAEGADGIVPVYHFGNTQLLDLFPQFHEHFVRKHQFAFGFLYGRFGLPIPRKREMYIVMGKPVTFQQTPETDPNFEKVVDETHTRVLQALQDLYDSHKKEYGWENRPLVIT